MIIRNVLIRELRARTGTKAYRIGTAVLLLAAAGSTVAVSVFDEPGSPGARSVALGVVDVQPAVLEALQATGGAAGTDLDVDVERFDDRAAAEAALADDDVEAVLDGRQLIWDGEPDPVVGAAVVAARQQVAVAEFLAETGVDPAALERLAGAAAVEDVDIGGADHDADGVRIGIAFLTTIATFLLIVTYGQLVAASVVEEKATRVIEVLLARITARQLLAGKILGVGAAVAVQVVIVVAGLGAALAATESVTVPSEVWGALPVLMACLVLGFLLYAVLFAGAGSLVSRQEDVQQTTLPLTVPIFAAYFYATSTLAGEGTAVMQALAFVPFTSPVVLPAAYARGWVSTAGAVVSIGILAVTAVVMLRIAAGVYERSLLKTGSRVPLRQVLNVRHRT